jgi:hypothetical protein
MHVPCPLGNPTNLMDDNIKRGVSDLIKVITVYDGL